MELTVKKFNELTTEELFEIYRVRVAVFVVEQSCAYQEVDSHDKNAYHVFLSDEGKIVAYLRVLVPGEKFDEASIGRVLTIKRRCGLGSRILAEGIKVAKEKYGAKAIRIEAQTYARSLYEKAGFVQVTDEFLEDGIPHIGMLRKEQTNGEA